MALIGNKLFCLLTISLLVKLDNVRCDSETDLINLNNLNFLQYLTREKSPYLTGSLNDYVDSILKELNTKIKYPIKIPDYNVSFDTEIILIPLEGSLQLFNAEIKTVGDISRSGDSNVDYKNDLLSLNLALKAQDVQFEGDFIAKFEDLGPSGSTSGSITELQVQAELTIDTKNIQATIKNFYMKAGSINLTVNILPGLDFILNTLIQLLIFIIKWPLLGIISGDIQVTLQNYLDSYTQLFQ